MKWIFNCTAAPVGRIVWAVLLTQTKIIWIAGTAIKTSAWTENFDSVMRATKKVSPSEKREAQMHVFALFSRPLCVSSVAR